MISLFENWKKWWESNCGEKTVGEKTSWERDLGRKDLAQISSFVWCTEVLNFLVFDTKYINILRNTQKKYIQKSKNKMKWCTKIDRASSNTQIHLQEETSNNKIHQEVFFELLRKDGAKCKYDVFRNAPGSFRGRERWEDGLKDYCYVLRHFQSHGSCLLEHFPAFFYTSIFYSLSAYSTLKLYRGQQKETTMLEKSKFNINFLTKCGPCNTPPKVIRFVFQRKSIQSINCSNQNSY